MFGSESAFIKIDMSEYSESHSVSKIIGSPPGYVGFKDVDVCIIDTITQKRYSVECKLSKKGGFHCKKGNPFIEIKCMRSRTLGEEAARQKSVLTGIPTNLLMIHNDQYTSSDFDIVITSIANAFYVTDDQGLFMWKPSQDGEEFLHRLSVNNQKDAF
jgi:hypothetical protein